MDSVKIILDRETRSSRGFAFVEMPDREQALAAIAGVNGKELGGMALKVNEARPREAQGGRNRERSGGGFGSGAPWPGGGGFGSRERSGGGYGNRDTGNIYDEKGGGRGGQGRRGGRGGRGSETGGRPGGGRRSR